MDYLELFFNMVFYGFIILLFIAIVSLPLAIWKLAELFASMFHN